MDHGIELTRTVTCPMPDKHRMLKDMDEQLFRSITGSLSWFAISMRYDIAHTVTRLQSQNQEPIVGALHDAMRVAAYVGSTADSRLGGNVCTGENKVRYYSDSDHGGDRGVTARSHTLTGVMLLTLLNDIPVQWRSKKQPETVASPAHAEIYACSEAVKEAKWLQWVATDLGIELPWPFIGHWLCKWTTSK